jgi:transposase
MAYGKDYVERAVAYKQEGHSFKELREAFGIPPNTYYDWAEKLNNGHYETTIKRERTRKIDKEALKAVVAQKPDAFLREHAEQSGCTPVAIHTALKKLGITRKKNIFILRKIRRQTG